MHSLYAISFMVYMMNALSDWFYLYFLLDGRITSFPLSPNFAIFIAGVIVIGSMLNGVLLVSFLETPSLKVVFFDLFFYRLI